MSREKLSNQAIPKLYRRKYEDIGMLFFVEAQRQIIPACTIEQCLYNYFRFTGNEDFNIESAIVTFSRLRAEFIDMNYENTKKSK